MNYIERSLLAGPVILLLVVPASLLLRRAAVRCGISKSKVNRLVTMYALTGCVVACASPAAAILAKWILDIRALALVPLLLGALAAGCAYDITRSSAVMLGYGAAALVATGIVIVADLVSMNRGNWYLLISLAAPLSWFAITHWTLRAWVRGVRISQLARPDAICLSCEYPLPAATADGVRTCPECGAKFEVGKKA